MKRSMYLVLVALLALTASAWAQDSMLGPHNVANKGCKSCHAPHNGSVMNGGTDEATGKIYLWGREFKATTYTTFGGGSLTTTATPAETDPVVHTQMCLSCHDGGITDVTMGDEAKVASDAESLENDHPVNVEYAVATSTRPYNWQISFSNGRASFVDTSAFSTTYGHPVRLYVSGDATAGYHAWLQCSTCHNPHSQVKAVYKIGATYQSKTSAKFVRGWYDPNDGTSQANFCRSCHYSKTEYYNGSISQ